MRRSLFVVAMIAILELAQSAKAKTEQEVLPARFATDSAHNCGWVMFSVYKAREVKRLDQLPGGIRRQLQEHLTSRLGEPFYHRFSFVGGQVVDWPAFRRAEPNPGYKWKVFTYNLMFELRAPEVGISRYCTSIELDAAGGVVKMAGFPPSRRLPHKARLLPVSHAYDVAAQNRFDVSKMRAELKYDQEIDSIIYRLTQTFKAQDGGRDRIIDVDAHSGRHLSVRWERWYHHYN